MTCIPIHLCPKELGCKCAKKNYVYDLFIFISMMKSETHKTMPKRKMMSPTVIFSQYFCYQRWWASKRLLDLFSVIIGVGFFMRYDATDLNFVNIGFSLTTYAKRFKFKIKPFEILKPNLTWWWSTIKPLHF